MGPMSEYRVNLEIYNGPIDLLLYLIRRDELDIYDIPIARITEQYVAYVDLLKKLDPNLAGEFLVMAAALLEIKTRMLLPAPGPEEPAGTEPVDPRTELVRQLLEYKSFKDAAGDLGDAAHRQAMRFARRPGETEAQGAPPELDLEDAQLWDLVDAFSRVMAAIGQAAVAHEVIYDDTPIELHEADIVDRLQREGAMTFDRIFEGRSLRSEIVGLFLALLELVRTRRVLAAQERIFGRIHVYLNPDPPPRETGEPAGEQPAAAPAQQQDAHDDGSRQDPATGH